jgi:hypothetical protein
MADNVSSSSASWQAALSSKSAALSAAQGIRENANYSINDTIAAKVHPAIIKRLLLEGAQH